MSTKCNKEGVKKSREDQRQADKIERLTNMSNFINSKVEELIKTVESDKFSKLPEIDRHICLMLVSSLETYSAALGIKLAWEGVRVRTSGGVHLNNDLEPFLDFLFGKQPKDKSCNKSCKAKCKKTK